MVHSPIKGASLHLVQANKPNALLQFLAMNESGFNNMTVYLFWIIMHSWFGSEYPSLSFPEAFIQEVREALCDQYRAIYFNYLIRLRHIVMDRIIDILPFFLAEIITTLIQTKLRNHELPISNNKTFILLISEVYKELYGLEISELSLK